MVGAGSCAGRVGCPAEWAVAVKVWDYNTSEAWGYQLLANGLVGSRARWELYLAVLSSEMHLRGIYIHCSLFVDGLFVRHWFLALFGGVCLALPSAGFCQDARTDNLEIVQSTDPGGPM